MPGRSKVRKISATCLRLRQREFFNAIGASIPGPFVQMTNFDAVIHEQQARGSATPSFAAKALVALVAGAIAFRAS